MKIEKSLEAIDAWLKTNRPKYYENLQPGASEADLDAFEARFQLKLPAEFRALYKWHDGQKPDYYKRLVDNYNFLSLSRVASAKQSQDSMIGEIFETAEWWQREWIPFLENGGGDYIVLDLTKGRLIEYWHDEEDRDVVSSSLAKWAKELAESMADDSYEAFSTD